MKPKINLPLAILIRGLPGSGKSYLARALAEALGASDVVILDPDATDYASAAYLAHARKATAEGVDPKLFAYRFLRQQAYDAIANGQIIIWNQPFTDLEIFQKMIGRLEDHASASDKSLAILVVEVVIDPATASARIEARKASGGHGPSAETLAKFVRDWTSASSLGLKTVKVDGTSDVDASVASVLAAIASV